MLVKRQPNGLTSACDTRHLAHKQKKGTRLSKRKRVPASEAGETSLDDLVSQAGSSQSIRQQMSFDNHIPQSSLVPHPPPAPCNVFLSIPKRKLFLLRHLDVLLPGMR